MSKFLKDALLVLLMFFVFAGVFIKGEDNNQEEISSSIQDFDDLVNGGEVVEDGFLENGDFDNDGNAISKGVLKTGETFIKILNKGIDFIISLVKKALD
jgi:hypothetical protein